MMGGDIELTGNLYCDFGDIEGVASGPEWIEFDRFCDLRAPDWNIHDGISLRVWGQAATRLLEQGSPVDGQYTVVGHFDDPGASECQSVGFDGGAPDPAEAAYDEGYQLWRTGKYDAAISSLRDGARKPTE